MMRKAELPARRMSAAMAFGRSQLRHYADGTDYSLHVLDLHCRLVIEARIRNDWMT